MSLDWIFRLVVTLKPEIVTQEVPLQNSEVGSNKHANANNLQMNKTSNLTPLCSICFLKQRSIKVKSIAIWLSVPCSYSEHHMDVFLRCFSCSVSLIILSRTLKVRAVAGSIDSNSCNSHITEHDPVTPPPMIITSKICS
ncbi:541_t:CDS:2 [Gigaspora rosea]|nr:541_t:CDS:2 [Gigaspora rosea]